MTDKIQATIKITEDKTQDMPWLLEFVVPGKKEHIMRCKTYDTALRAASLFELDWHRHANFTYSTPDKEEIVQAATKLREAQKAYMADRGNDKLGKKVAEAAEKLDLVLKAHNKA